MHTVSVQKNGKVSAGTLADLKSSNTVWVDMVAPTEEELDQLASYTNIEPIHIKEWLQEKKRPTAYDFQKYSVLIFLAPVVHSKKNGTQVVSAEPCIMLVSNDRNDFVTIHQHPLHAITEIMEYSEKYRVSIFSQRATFLLFTLINEIIEHYYDALDAINDTVQKAESLAVVVKPKNTIMHQILGVKKSLIYFHKALTANREVVGAIEREHLGFLDDELLREFRILSSSITQLIEINSTYREILNTATEIHLAVISNNLNTTMKKVTGWAAIILIPSLVAGIFGMNFKHFSVFEWELGVEFSFVLMILSVGALYWFFSRKDWL